MTPARGRLVPVIAVLAALVGWILLDLWTAQGGQSPPLPWTTVIGLGAVAAAVLVAGRQVRRTVHGAADRPVSALAAARVAVLTKACAYGGAALAGWYAAQGLVLLPDLVGDRRVRALVALAAALAAVAVCAAGLVAQRWCRVPPPPDPPSDPPVHA